VRSTRATTSRVALPSPLAENVAEVEMPAALAPVPLGSAFVPVVGSFDEPAILTGRFGSGIAVWWAASIPLANGGLARGEHLELFLNTLGAPGSRTILWDEFYHGHARSLWSYLGATPLPAAIAQLLLVAAIALFTFTRRKQPLRSPVAEPRTSPLEFIDTMGGLYERARASQAAIGTIRQRLRRRLLDAAGLPPSTADDRLAAVASERLGLGADIQGILSRARTAETDPDLTSAQAVALATELQALSAGARSVQRQRQREQ
jgi:hypothetical protein